jgi:hypothetical protein
MITDKQEKFIQTLSQSLGIVSLALQKTDVKRSEYDKWMDNIFFKEAVKEVHETSIDFVENQLMKEIQGGNITAITYYLKTKGKKRGY